MHHHHQQIPAAAGRPAFNETRPTLAVTPEVSLDMRCDFPPHTSLCYLQHHAVAYFTDINELWPALEIFSLADLFVAEKYSTSAMYDRNADIGLGYPDGYITSLGGRPVAAYCLAPAPLTYRALEKPGSLGWVKGARADLDRMSSVAPTEGARSICGVLL